jgi:membrane protein YqaA with SNARE-associated domain
MSAWLAAAWVPASCFGLSVVSALVPWVNAEAILLAFASSARSGLDLVALVLVTTAGQMLGKCVLYFVARRARHRQVRGHDGKVERWRRRLERSPRAALTLVFVSSVVGLPPFYVVTMVAGACGVGLAGYLGAGTAGRLVRFGTLVAVPRLALGALG